MCLTALLQKDPLDRYETGEEMAADIEEVNEELKREQVGEALGNVKHLMELEQWPSRQTVVARPAEPQSTKYRCQEIAPRSAGENLAATEDGADPASDGEAEEAVLTQRYKDALDFYKLAEGLDKQS